MKIAISGSHGLIGAALTDLLRASGHEVLPIVRGQSTARCVGWEPAKRLIDAPGLAGSDAVVHLAGAGIGDHRWSPAYKEAILSSRVEGTSTIASALAGLANPPATLISASAVGFYGSRGTERLTEESGAGSGFLAGVCQQWEKATAEASDAGIRVAHLRTGIVLSASGGALKRQIPASKLIGPARLGNGEQYMSWITRRDAVAAILHLLDSHELAGPFNLTAPEPVTNAEFTKAFARALHRPDALAVPAAVLKLGAGAERASELLLVSQAVLPEALLSSGYRHQDGDLSGALKTALADR